MAINDKEAILFANKMIEIVDLLNEAVQDREIRAKIYKKIEELIDILS